MKRSSLSRHAPLRPKTLPQVSPRDHVDSMLLKLDELYPREEWVTLREVRSSTGLPEVVRYADALAVRLLGAGWDIHGFEIKRTRSDWVAELEDPLKSAPLKLFCSAWWLVVPAPANRIVLSLQEVPDLWGFAELGTGAPNVLRWPVERRAESPESHPGFLKSLFRSMASAERADAADVGAPLKRINRIIDRRHVGLVCNHVALAPLAKGAVFPLAVPCWACADGRPPDHEVLEVALLNESGEGVERLRVLLDGRVAGERGGAA